MFATNAEFQIAALGAPFFDCQFNNRPDTDLIETGKRVFFHNPLRNIGGQEMRRIIAANAQSGLRQIIRAEREKCRFLCQIIGHDGGARHFNHRAQHISLRLNAIFIGQRWHQRFQNTQFCGIDNQREHNLDRRFALIVFHGSKNGAQLHGVNFRRCNAQATAAMTEHRIAFHQFTNTPAQLLFALPQRLCQWRNIIIWMRQKFVQRRVEQANGHGPRTHCFEQGRKIILLHGQQLVERLFASRRIIGQNHFAHPRNALRVEKHMFGATQANAFRPEAQCAFGIARRFSIGAHAHFAPRIGPAHQRAKIAGQFSFQSRHGAQHDAPRCAVNGNDIAFFQFMLFDLRRLAVIINMQLTGARYTGPPKPTRHHGCMAGHAAARGQNGARRIHAVNIFRAGFHPHQHHVFSLCCECFSTVSRKSNFTACRAGRSGQAFGQHIHARARVKCRVEQMFQ